MKRRKFEVGMAKNLLEDYLGEDPTKYKILWGKNPKFRTFLVVSAFFQKLEGKKTYWRTYKG